MINSSLSQRRRKCKPKTTGDWKGQLKTSGEKKWEGGPIYPYGKYRNVKKKKLWV